MPALSIQDYFMRTRFQVVITLLLSLYLPVVLFTDISLTGFWTDVIFSILSCVFVLRLAFKKKTQALWLTVILRTLAIICSFTVFGLIFLNFTNPFVADLFKLRSFYFQKVEGRMFNAYFKPVGAYSGGWGNFWITESPIYIAIIEKRVYYERAVRHDFSDDYWEGEPIDNYEVVRDYIKDEVIKKGK